MRIAIVTGVTLVLAAQGAEAQGARCFALEFPDSAPTYREGLAGDTLVLSDLPLGDLEDMMPGGRRAFLGLPAYRDPAPLTHHAEAWRAAGSDSVYVRPLLSMVALIWRAEITGGGMTGEARVVTDEIGAPEPIYRFRAPEVSCPGRDT